MLGTVTVTSKRQITIPVDIFNALNLSYGDKLIVEKTNNRLVLQREQDALDDLVGSLQVSDELKKIDLDEAIRIAKYKYFSKKS